MVSSLIASNLLPQLVAVLGDLLVVHSIFTMYERLSGSNVFTLRELLLELGPYYMHWVVIFIVTKYGSDDVMVQFAYIVGTLNYMLPMVYQAWRFAQD